jgi:hypothetical protein
VPIAADAVVDELDGFGSRVLHSVDDAKAFLMSQGLVEEQAFRLFPFFDRFPEKDRG